MLKKVFGLRQAGEARFKSEAAGEGGMRVYGGFTLAQSLLAALSSVGDGWTCYVMHVQFIRPAGPDDTLEYHLDATSDGRSFATRRVTCVQSGKDIITATMGFRRRGEGLNFQQQPPPFPVSPDGLPSERERSLPLMEYLRAQGLNPQELPSGIDVRLTEAQDYFDPKRLPAVHPFWIRASEPFPDDPVGRQVAVAFCSDFNTNEPALRPHGFSWIKPEALEIASLDHSLWFFDDTDMTQWHLHEVGAVHTGGGIGTTTGRMFDSGGRMVAATTQVAMMRSSTSTSPG